MLELEYKEAYIKKKNQLDSILVLTSAINSDADETALFGIFNSIISVHANLKKHILILCNENADIKSSEGIDDVETYQNEFRLKGKESLKLKNDFNEYFNILHQGKSLAHVFLSFDDLLSKKEQLSFIKSLTNIVLVAVENKKYISKKIEREAYEKEVAIAQNVQNLLFPHQLPKNDRLEMYADYIPHKAVGGDYYDYIQKSETEYIICIADVSGKGVPAALLMSNFQATLRTLVRQNLNLREIVNELNTVALSHTNGVLFITAFIALVFLKRDSLFYINVCYNLHFYIDIN